MSKPEAKKSNGTPGKLNYLLGAAIIASSCCGGAILSKNQQANESTQDASQEAPEIQGIKSRFKKILEGIAASKPSIVSEDTGAAIVYQPEDEESRMEFMNEALACFETEGNYSCTRSSSWDTHYICLPPTDNAENLRAVEIHQPLSRPEECKGWIKDYAYCSNEVNFPLKAEMSMYNGTSTGAVKFNPNDLDNEKFCGEILEWGDSEKHNTKFEWQETSEGTLFEETWNDFGMSGGLARDLSEDLSDQLSEAGFDFTQENSANFFVYIDDEKYEIDLISNRPTSFGSEMGDNFDENMHFEISPVGVRGLYYPGEDGAEIAEWLIKLQEE